MLSDTAQAIAPCEVRVSMIARTEVAAPNRCANTTKQVTNTRLRFRNATKIP